MHIWLPRDLFEAEVFDGAFAKLAVELVQDLGFQHLELLFPGGGFDFNQESAAFDANSFGVLRHGFADDIFPDHHRSLLAEALLHAVLPERLV
jgi:hypothetical protein